MRLPTLPSAAFLVLSAACAPALLAQVGEQHPMPDQHQDVPLCTTNQVALTANGADGDFNGMSHSGTYLVLRNISPAACRVPPLPEITFYGPAHDRLAITREVPGTVGMHPGPVVLPVELRPDATLRSTLRWVSGPVFGEGGVCLTVTTVELVMGEGLISAPMGGATVCGPAAGKVTLEMSRFQPLPAQQPIPAR